MQTLEQRVAKLERGLLIYRSSTIVLLLAGIFLLVSSFDKPAGDIIKAKELQVLDNSGKTCIKLSADNGSGDLKLYSSEGVAIVHMLESTSGTGVVAIEKKDGNLACRIGDYTSGAGCIQVYNTKGTSVSELGSTDRGTGYIDLKNDNGNEMFKVTYTNGNYAGWMGIYNYSGQNILRVSGSDDGDGTLDIYNHLSNEICILGSDKTSAGALNVYDAYGKSMNGVWPK